MLKNKKKKIISNNKIARTLLFYLFTRYRMYLIFLCFLLKYFNQLAKLFSKTCIFCYSVPHNNIYI